MECEKCGAMHDGEGHVCDPEPIFPKPAGKRNSIEEHNEGKVDNRGYWERRNKRQAY